MPAQLDSLRAQTHADWRLWVGDDGSTDDTRAILHDFDRTVPQEVRVLDGPQKGVAANALALLRHPDLPLDAPVAFCDQDDVWYPDRLARALRLLDGRDGPALYGARTEIGEDPGGPLTPSPLWPHPPSFANALIQSYAGANTMVLNPRAVALARQAARGPRPAFHDWWLYALICGVGGEVVFDPEPVLFYRQHDGNTLGRNRGLAARYARLGTIRDGTYHHWVTRNTRALLSALPQLTEENRLILSDFTAMRRRRGLAVLRRWQRIGLHRQSRAETVLMAVAAAMGRV